jgi:hypothetical protein
MLISTIISLSKRIVAFRKFNRKSVILVTRNIEERRVVISQCFVVERLEFMFRVVREEGNLLIHGQSLLYVVEMLCAYSGLFNPGIRTSKLLCRLN